MSAPVGPSRHYPFAPSSPPKQRLYHPTPLGAIMPRVPPRRGLHHSCAPPAPHPDEAVGEAAAGSARLGPVSVGVGVGVSHQQDPPEKGGSQEGPP